LLGKVAYEAVMGFPCGSVNRSHGWIKDVSPYYGIYLMPHPAFYLRSMDKKETQEEKHVIAREALEHWLKIKTYIEENPS
jgi:hypothetical protein